MYTLINKHSKYSDLYPCLQNEIKDLKFSKLIDYGSGDGCFLKYLNLSNADLFDINKGYIEQAKSNLKGEFNFFINKYDLVNNKYDLIICNLVLMELDSEERFNELLETMYRISTSDVHIFFSITHPCFLCENFDSYQNDFTLGNKEFIYSKNGEPYNVYFQDKNNNTVTVRDYFWNLSFIFNKITSYNFILTKTIETESKNYSNYLILKFKKQ